MGFQDDVSKSTQANWQAAKDAAQNLKDALDKAAHTSPADAAHSVVTSTKTHVDNLLLWLHNKMS